MQCQLGNVWCVNQEEKLNKAKKLINDSSNTSDDGIVITGVSKCSSEKSASLVKLNDGHH